MALSRRGLWTALAAAGFGILCLAAYAADRLLGIAVRYETGPIQGLVLDAATGRRLAGIQVERLIQLSMGPDIGRPVTARAESVRTGPDGAFVFPGRMGVHFGLFIFGPARTIVHANGRLNLDGFSAGAWDLLKGYPGRAEHEGRHPGYFPGMASSSYYPGHCPEVAENIACVRFDDMRIPLVPVLESLDRCALREAAFPDYQRKCAALNAHRLALIRSDPALCAHLRLYKDDCLRELGASTPH